MSDRAKITELRDKRAELFQAMSELNASALADERDFTPEEQEKYDKIEADFDGLSNQIARSEKLAGIEPKLTREAAVPETVERAIEEGTLDVAEEKTARQQITEKPEYRAAFRDYLRHGDKASAESRAALQVGTDSEGGYLVPDEFHRTLVESQRVFGVARQLATVITTTENGQLLIPKVATAGTAALTAEEAAFTESEDTFGQAVLDAYKYGTIIKVSDELVADSAFDIMSFVARRAGQAIGIATNTHFTTGDGSSKPQGWNSAATTGKTAASATAVTASELIDLFHSVLAPYRAASSWVMKDATAAAIRKLADSTGQFLWQPGLQAGQPDLLLGRPVYTDPDVPAMTTGLDSIGFGDFSGFWIRDVEGVAVKVLDELYAANGQIGIRVHSRTDSELVDSAAVKVLTQA